MKIEPTKPKSELEQLSKVYSEEVAELEDALDEERSISDEALLKQQEAEAKRDEALSALEKAQERIAKLELEAKEKDARLNVVCEQRNRLEAQLQQQKRAVQTERRGREGLVNIQAQALYSAYTRIDALEATLHRGQAHAVPVPPAGMLAVRREWQTRSQPHQLAPSAQPLPLRRF